MAAQSLAHRAVPAAQQCLLEADFPWVEISRLVQADQAHTDPVYAAHKWWARRPRGLIRALIVGAHLPADAGPERLWEMFADDDEPLKGRHVGDCFHGGGTTVVEATRLGASATGIDVDPLAQRILDDQLAHVDADQMTAAGQALLSDVREELGWMYPASGDGAQPLHYFRLREVACPGCDHQSLLYRSLVLARDIGRAGAVVRDNAQDVFCPDCCRLHDVAEEDTEFVCCEHQHRLDASTFSRAGFRCPKCETLHPLADVRPAAAPDKVIAVEETVGGGRRRLRGPSDEDLEALERARLLRAALEDKLPQNSLAGIDGGRPHGYGFAAVSDLFGDRQALVLDGLRRWLTDASFDDAVKGRLALGVSNAIASNNRLCGYATDYGRLAPAFTGVRSYALPILAVELAPLHPAAGRGTLAAVLRRLRRGGAKELTRRVHPDREDAAAMSARREVPTLTKCQTAERPFPDDLGPCTAIITDPPYYDFIAYSDLSLLQRAWFTDEAQLGGVPIYPVGENGHETFINRLGREFAQASKALDDDAVLAFTYHSREPEPWQALAQAVRKVKLTVTAVFPVWADARGYTAHGHPGSCEWDLVWVCRPGAREPEVPSDDASWRAGLSDFEVGEADHTSMCLGLAAAQLVNAPGVAPVGLQDLIELSSSVRAAKEAAVS